MSKVVRRDISPFLQDIRNFLLGRKHTNALRFEDGLAARTQPPPELPNGPSHKYSANYYLARDARRDVSPPSVIATNQKMIIGISTQRTKLPTPGTSYRWDEH